MAVVPRTAWAPLALVAALLLASVPAQGAYRTFGDAVDGSTTDKDVTHLLLLDLAVAEATAVAWDDADSSNTISSTEGVYLDTDADGEVSVGDIRFRGSSGSGLKGAPVKSSDADCCGDITLTTALGSFGFVDVYPGGALDGELGLGDPVFLDLDGGGTVSTADIKVVSAGSSAARPLASGAFVTTSGAASFAAVTGSDPDINSALVDLAGNFALRAFDANGNGNVDNSDTVYLDLAQDGGATPDRMPGPGDVRLSKPLSGSSLAAGTMPDGDDADTVHQLLAAAGAQLALSDTGNSAGVAENGEGIYLDMDASNDVTVNDVRLILSDTTTLSGKQVLSTDTGDLGDPLIAWPGNGFRFRDLNSNTVFDAADHLYVELDSDGIAEVGDFKLAKGSGATTSAAVGRLTSSASADLTGALLAATPTISYYDVTGGGGYTKGDVVFLDFDGDGLVTAGDVRVSTGSAPFTTFGETITDAETEMEYCFSQATSLDFSGSLLGFRDDDNDNIADNEEMVYFDRNGDGTTDTLDVRLSTVTGGPGAAGTFIASGNGDNNKALDNVLLTALGWDDSNNDGDYSLKGLGTTSDGVYLDLNTVVAGTVAVRDLRVTDAGTGTGNAGSKVGSSSTDSGATLTFFAPALFGIDGNGDQLFNTQDSVYISVDDAAETALGLANCATPGDVRISGGGSTTSSGGGGGGGGGGSTGGTSDSGSSSSGSSSDSGSSSATDSSSSSSSSSSASSSTSSSSSGAPNAASLNQQLAASLQVKKEGDANTLTWTDVSGEDGYQVWSHDSPYALIASLPAGATTYKDENGGADTTYLVTAVVGGATLTADDVNGGAVPGYSGVPAGEAPAEGKKGFIPAPSPVVALAALVAVALLARRRLR